MKKIILFCSLLILLCELTACSVIGSKLGEELDDKADKDTNFKNSFTASGVALDLAVIYLMVVEYMERKEGK